MSFRNQGLNRDHVLVKLNSLYDGLALKHFRLRPDRMREVWSCGYGIQTFACRRL